MRPRILVALCVLGLSTTGSAQSARLEDVKIRGYVTEVTSPTSFEIEDYRITRAEGFSLDFENASPDVTFKLEDIRVGVEVEIRGLLNQNTGELKAKSMKVDLEQFRSTKQTAIVSRSPRGLQQTPEGWNGRFFADGQTIIVTPKTRVLFKSTTRERKILEQARNRARRADAGEEEFEPLSSLDQVMVGMAMTYEGRRNPEDGAILAERVEFSNNDLEDGEAKMWRSLKTSIKTAQGLKPGELKIDRVGKFKLLPSNEVQQYVTRVAQSLIPPYQAELGPDDPLRIPFQFHVVLDDQANAFATPNGVVVVNSGLIALLENEAQLAAVLGHEIAHSTHEHSWRASQFHKKKRIGLAIAAAVASAYGQHALADIASLVQGAIQSGHQRSLENQSDRVGLGYMVQAGYDPRQAPAVWKLMTRKYGLQPTNFFWSSHENQATRRSYLMNELKNNYRDLDYRTLKTNAEEFVAIKAAVADAKNAKRRIKVTAQ